MEKEATATKTLVESFGDNGQLGTTTSLLIPVIQEELSVEIHKYRTGTVRVTKTVVEKEQAIDLTTSQTSFVVERVPLNKVVSAPPPMREEGETMVFSIVEEVLVTTTQYVVKEEVRISRQHSQTPRQERSLLRAEELVIEREPVSVLTSFAKPEEI